MKRFHVHVAVANLASSIDFYSKLFGQAPAKERPDYAKWMLDDPRVNFAISERGHATGVNHCGFQVDGADELQSLKQLAESAMGEQVLDQGETACCYAKSERHWTVAPKNLSRWLYTIARNTVIDFYRAKRPTDVLPDDLVVEDSGNNLTEHALSECLRPLTEQLPACWRRTFTERP